MRAEGRYGLIGQTLGHSFSPVMHRFFGEYSYELFELSEGELAEFLTAGDFQGLNVTIPYKKTAMAYCHALTEAAQRIGCINTILRQPDGTLLGDNTDYDGFAYMLRHFPEPAAGKKVLVLGGGGASLTVRAVLEQVGAGAVVNISRRGENHYGNLDRHRDAQLIVNTTPVGMFPNMEHAPVDLAQFPSCQGVLDLIYNPVRTKLLLQAQALGIAGANGLTMLAAQARGAAERFLHTSIPDERVAQAAAAVEGQTRNILLVGMPGCGKSAVARTLAKRLGRKLADIDTMAEKAAGCSIPALFAQRGEEAFRQLEHQMLAKAIGATGQVIATGGGIVTRQENWDLMRQTAWVVFLRRPLALLETCDRPITRQLGLEELYRRRLPLYEGVADFSVDNLNLDTAVEEIMRGCKL